MIFALNVFLPPKIYLFIIRKTLFCLQSSPIPQKAKSLTQKKKKLNQYYDMMRIFALIAASLNPDLVSAQLVWLSGGSLALGLQLQLALPIRPVGRPLFYAALAASAPWPLAVRVLYVKFNVPSPWQQVRASVHWGGWDRTALRLGNTLHCIGKYI